MPQPPTRASRARRATFLACAATVVAAVGISAPPAGAKSPKPVVKMAPGAVTVYKIGDAPETIPDDVRNAVMATLTGYVNAATVQPLQKGAVDDAGLATTLAPSVAARLAGPDRATLVDEGLPKATSKIKVSATPVALTGLADGAGTVVVVTANVNATTTTKTAKGRLVIKRTGDLVLEPDNGTWKITGYTLNVVRAGRAAVPTPTTTVPAAPAAAAPTPATAAK